MPGGKGQKIAASTQENLEIAGVEDGIVILRDGSYRLVFEISAVNFGLKRRARTKLNHFSIPRLFEFLALPYSDSSPVTKN